MKKPEAYSVANPQNTISLIRNTYKLCGAKNAHVELLHMVPVPDQVALSDAEKYISEGGNTFDIDDFVKTNISKLHISPKRVKTLTVESNNIINAILSESSKHDLVVIGSTEQPWLNQITHATMPELIAQKCNLPLVVVKASGGIKSWIKRWILKNNS